VLPLKLADGVLTLLADGHRDPARLRPDAAMAITLVRAARHRVMAIAS
jgi:hypothetical protein